MNARQSCRIFFVSAATSKFENFAESKAGTRCIVITEGVFPMKKMTILVVAACLVLVTGCRWVGIRGNGHIKTDERTIGAFANIDASGSFQIEWKNGAPALSITTDENLFPYIDNHISGDTLHLDTHEHIWPTHGIKVVMSYPRRGEAQRCGEAHRESNLRAEIRFGINRRSACQPRREHRRTPCRYDWRERFKR